MKKKQISYGSEEIFEGMLVDAACGAGYSFFSAGIATVTKMWCPLEEAQPHQWAYRYLVSTEHVCKHT